MTTMQTDRLEVISDAIDQADVIALVDERDTGGHVIRNLVLLVVAATVVGAIVMAIRGRSS